MSYSSTRRGPAFRRQIAAGRGRNLGNVAFTQAMLQAYADRFRNLRRRQGRDSVDVIVDRLDRPEGIRRRAYG
jgi:hypothetical protein